MSNVLTHPWEKKKKGSSPVWGLRQHKIYYKGFRNYSSFTALKLSNYSQLLPICLRLLIKGCGSSPPSRPPEASWGARTEEGPPHCGQSEFVHEALSEMERKPGRHQFPSCRWWMLTWGVTYRGRGLISGAPLGIRGFMLTLGTPGSQAKRILVEMGELVGLFSSVYAQYTETVKLDLLPASPYPHTSSLRPSPLQPSFPSGPCSYIS